MCGPSLRSNVDTEKHSLRITTVNIKNVETNQQFLLPLLNKSDVVCLQETWLFNYQQNSLNLIHTDFESNSKSVDDDNPIPPCQKPRGYGGVAALTKKNVDLRFRKKLDGGKRIVVTEIDTEPPICICNVYMPARNSREKDEFQQTLLEVEEILQKYTNTHAVLFVGDMNSSLCPRQGNEHDEMFGKFCKDNGLHSNQSGVPTFFHCNGKDQAEIDYILFNDKAKEIINNIEVVKDNGLNTSDHIPVMATLRVQTSTTEKKPVTIRPKPRWDKCDLEMYKECVTNNLKKAENMDSDLDILMSLGHLTTVLKQATAESIPKHKEVIVQKEKKVKVWSEKVKLAVAACKKSWWEWRQKGEPDDRSNPLVVRMKECKRDLRREQRRTHARARDISITNIMAAHPDSKQFHRLVREQRKTAQSTIQSLNVDNTVLETTEDIRTGWATYFEKLATPLNHNQFEDTKEIFSSDVEHIQSICEASQDTIEPFTVKEVNSAIHNLNNNKAADIMDLTSEHLKYGGDTVTDFVKDLLNSLSERKKVPSVLKEGVLTPVFKKGDNTDPGNYRGITVTPVVLKVLEHILNRRHNIIYDVTQSRLQKGFTAGQSSIDAALILSECIAESKNKKQPLIVTTLDAQKAFDVVDHDSLLRKLYLDGIQGGEWLLLKDLYTDLTSVVKWEGSYSDAFKISQGVRQGGVLSTSHYKRYNNPLLLQLEDKFRGASIGHINIPHATCADDLALLSHNCQEMQVMINSVENFARRERYCINPTKSCVLIYDSRASQRKMADQYSMYGKQLNQDTSTKHLGIQRIITNSVDIDEKLNISRKAAYSLMGAGFHGGNGLKPCLNAYLWRAYVVPRLVYGLEVMDLKKSQTERLELFQRKCLKQLQGLPDKTPNTTTLALLGIPPVSTIIHKNILNLFGKIVRNKNGVEYEIAVRQLAMKSSKEKSWFNTVKDVLSTYNLPTAYTLLQSPPTKKEWKRAVDKATKELVESTWADDIRTKSSLKYINTTSLQVGKPHHIWESVRNNPHDSRRAQIKCRLLTGTYTLQSNRAVFNQYTVDPTCKLCDQAPETRQHFLAECKALESERNLYLKNISGLMSTESIDQSDPGVITQLILDSSLYVDGKDKVNDLELRSREYIVRVHNKLNCLLAGVT